MESESEEEESSEEEEEEEEELEVSFQSKLVQTCPNWSRINPNWSKIVHLTQRPRSKSTVVHNCIASVKNKLVQTCLNLPKLA